MRAFAPSLPAAVVLAATIMAQVSRADDTVQFPYQTRGTTARGGSNVIYRAEFAAETAAEAREESEAPPQPGGLPRDAGYANAVNEDEAAQRDPSPFIEEPTRAPLRPSPLPLRRSQPPRPAPYDNGNSANTAVGFASSDEWGSSEQTGGGERSPSCHGGLVTPPVRALAPQALARRGIEVGGWIDQGYTANPSDPQAEPFNGPVGFNDFPNEYQLNQLWVFLDRPVQRGGYGWDIGGRVDVNYGTDSRFIVANGLENTWNGATGFYDVAMPQLYADVAYNDLSIRVGHFFTILGYEYAQAPKNFFYSHSYTKIYGQALTYTGALATYDATDRLSVIGGFQRGWNQWSGNNDNLGFLGGATYDIAETGSVIRFALSTGANDAAGQNDRTVYSIVYEQELPLRLSYVLQNDLGREENTGTGGRDAYWYSVVNYLFYAISDKWSVGARYEMFDDEDGVRVRGIGAPKGYQCNAIPTLWQDVTLGVKYMHNPNVTVRSEVRWDWAEPLVGVAGGPFNDYTSDRQFLWSLDLIVQF